MLPEAMTLGLKEGLAAAALAVATAACAATSYAGVSLVPGAADPELQALSRRAQHGDKFAQLELGTRFEEGRGVLKDIALARRLYAAAAAPARAVRHVYIPPVGKQPGRMMSIPDGPPQGGLAEARCRLARIELRAYSNAPTREGSKPCTS